MESIKESGKVPKDLQIAFKKLASSLIFGGELNLNISRKNIDIVSRVIMGSFIGEYINAGYENVRDSEPIFDYSHIGFTPALAQEADRTAIGLNCVGTAIFLGSIENVMKREGKQKIYMGLGANHPEVFIKTANEWMWATVGKNETKYFKIEPTVEEFKDFKIFRFDEAVLGSESKFFVVFDFRKAMLYEILENFAYLRSVSKGEVEEFLPGSKEYVLEICKKFKNEIEAGDWKKLQEILFPEITEAFEKVAEEMQSEINRVKSTLEEDTFETYYQSARKKAEDKIISIFEDKTFLEKISSQLQRKKKEVIKFLEYGDRLGWDENGPLFIFLETFKNELQKTEKDLPGMMNYAFKKVKKNLKIKN